MATASQKLHGPDRPVEGRFSTTDTTVAFAVGDLVSVLSGVCKITGTDTTAVSGAGGVFLGVSAQKKLAGITGTALRLFGNSTDGVIRIDTDGEYEFDRSDTIALTVGDLMAPDGSTANTLAKTSTESYAVGRVVQNAAASSARVRIKIQSRQMPSGPIS